MPTPDPEHYAFVDLLFERFLFEWVHLRNHTIGCCISPEALSMQLDLIGHYYTAIAMTTFQRLCGEAIYNRGFFNYGILSYLCNHQRQQQQPFKIFPNSFAAKFDLEIQSDWSSKVCDHIFCPWMSHKQIKVFKRDYRNKVLKEYQREFEFLVDMLDQNGLLRVLNCDTEPEFLSCKNEKVPVTETPIRHVDNPQGFLQEAGLLNNIKSITSLEPVLLSSSAKGINNSDYDVEIVLVASETAGNFLDSATPVKSKEETNSNTLATTTAEKNCHRNSGYKSIQHIDQYFDPSSEINVDYLSFIDPRSDLTCQITLDHPLDIRIRDLLQDYADIDIRVESLIFVVQQTLDNSGRCRQYLGNYALALMTIAFLRTKKILPLLQRHLVQPPFASSTQSIPVASTKSSRAPHSILSTSTFFSRRQPNDKRQSLPKSAQATQPRKRQQESFPAASMSQTQIKNQKRKDKRRINREKTLPVETVQVKSVSGRTRMVDCQYDKALAHTRPFDNKTTRETVPELLVDFMDYFEFSHRSTQCEISTISGSTTSSVGISDLTSGSQPAQNGIFKDAPPCLVVRDPFVTDRNVTWLCSQWRLSHCERMFMRAFMFLRGVDVDIDDDDDEDDGNFGLGSDNVSGGVGKDELLEEIYAGHAGYACDYDKEDEEDLSDNETYPIVAVDEVVDQFASKSLLALLASVSTQARL
ncbi:hypothetical protein BG015_003111 [Linnemannia schmuckeri]|uniref:Uncharacterized protein n=1 Tax=Linnemannia schmuckeri TaxID=64567 RepID=A0A9P5S2I3_9FUNG|nr:hypothetical protein BG015_003111 [Linnemannia schmuckeri]